MAVSYTHLDVYKRQTGSQVKYSWGQGNRKGPIQKIFEMPCSDKADKTA